MCLCVKEDIIDMINLGVKRLLLKVPGVKGEWQLGLLSRLWNDQGFYCTVFPEIVGALRLRRFPNWPPNNLSSCGVLHGRLLMPCQLHQRERDMHEKLPHADNAPSGKMRQDNEVKCDKCYRPWELCSLVGCLDLLLFHIAFKRGNTLNARLGESPRTESRHGDYGFSAGSWS